jgi:hypothetical protein
LGTKSDAPRIESMHLLGAAVGRKGDWRTLNDAVSGTVLNYWSSQDEVLRRVYAVAELGQRAVGQAGFDSRFPRIKDRNVSRTVRGHSGYFADFELAHS